MHHTVSIRPETGADKEQISLLLQEAFQGHPFSQNNEHLIVAALRREDAMTLALVAEEDKKVIGHIAFSPVMIENKDHQWHGLGPLAVIPHKQKKGIGKSLVNTGLAILKELNSGGCVVLGDPAYYQQFGFKPEASLVFKGVPAEYFMALNFKDLKPSGHVQYHQAFTESL